MLHALCWRSGLSLSSEDNNELGNDIVDDDSDDDDYANDDHGKDNYADNDCDMVLEWWWSFRSM